MDKPEDYIGVKVRWAKNSDNIICHDHTDGVGIVRGLSENNPVDLLVEEANGDKWRIHWLLVIPEQRERK